jgi:Ca2+:H+ antiporter
LFFTLILVLVGWAAGIDDMSLQFNPFEVTVVFHAVLVVQGSMEENKNGWRQPAPNIPFLDIG